MDYQLFAIILLTFVIHLIGTLAFAFRIAGIRTGQIAIAFSLFNAMVLISRTSNSFQAPLLAKRVESSILDAASSHLQSDFALILASASVATILGGLLIPTVQRVATGAVASFKQRRNLVRLMLNTLTPRGVAVVMQSVALPRYQNLTSLKLSSGFPAAYVLMNFAATALWTVGVLSAIYAGSIDPEFRVTASSLSAVINGVATIMMFVLIDPYLAGLTDDVVEGEVSHSHYRRVLVWMVLSRLAGTVFAQILLVPGAHLIVAVARWI
ncbi:lipid II flippase Amj family protein [Hoeflea sp. EC-HK425]|uniref:lipid II flippase Amj family protein n=1 Tax=Hoeflea sp. EC-HK425 TaxID=2038388 RepID=UPI001258D826|nr:lipid II flippase Amj family protein [Hoeflea sp. EC-HK425]VVT18978.1 Lipid II flippase Amj [Hoeflea sp. EC-HK425]|tara:strand:- start:756 stop:1559 length:804 start_codon:yes stop_codon:yes gene_type:complete